MILTANGLPILRASLLRPRVGVWTLDLTVDPGEDGTGLTGAVAVTLGDLTLSGTVVAGEVLPEGVWTGRVVGGAGGLGRTVPALALRACTLADVLGQTLTDAGEVLDGASGDLARPVARWQRVEAPASRTVADVARAAGLDWRVTPAGAVWLGTDTWPTVTPSEVTLVRVHPITQAVTVAGDAAVTIAPGTTLALDGWSPVRVGAVEVTVDVDAETVTIYPERAGGAGRLLDAFRSLVREAAPVDRFALYPTRVASQSADGALDLVPDDPRLAPCQAVPIRLGIPGVTVEVAAGARVLLGFEGGDPAAPVATLWEPGTVTVIRINRGDTPVAREGDDVSTSAAMAAWCTSVTAKVNTLAGAPTPAAPSVLGTVAEGSDVLRVP